MSRNIKFCLAIVIYLIGFCLCRWMGNADTADPGNDNGIYVRYIDIAAACDQCDQMHIFTDSCRTDLVYWIYSK